MVVFNLWRYPYTGDLIGISISSGDVISRNAHQIIQY